MNTSRDQVECSVGALASGIRLFGLCVAAVSFNAAGTALDPGFGTGGRQYTPIATSSATFANAVALQADSKIVSVGETRIYAVTVRQLDNGAADLSFNGSGTRLETVNGVGAPANAVAIQPDGKIVIGGKYTHSIGLGTGSVSHYGPFFARYNADGSLDASFAGGGESPGILRGYPTYGDGEARGILVRGDGKIVGLNSARIARHHADGSLDATFGAGGIVATGMNAGAASLLADGRIVTFGTRMNAFPANTDLAFVRHSESGVQEISGFADSGGFSYGNASGAVQADGKILVAGPSGTDGAVVRFLPSGALDTAFATNGRFVVAGGAVLAVAVQADGKIVLLVAHDLVVRLLPSGALDTSFGVGGRFPVYAGDSGDLRALALQPDGRIVVAGGGSDGTSPQQYFLARIDPEGQPFLVASPSTLDFGGESMGTTSPAQVVTITNASGTARAVDVSVSNTQFEQTNDCPAFLAPSATCTATVRFTPAVAPPLYSGPYGDMSVRATLRITSDDPAGPTITSLAGVAERSLITHFYRSILRRAPDPAGKAYWQGEAIRAYNLNMSANEAWYAMAMDFYASTEYAGFNRDNASFVIDLYRTFLNRTPDSGGLAYWQGQLDSGLPREVALASFMFSSEFSAFAQALFGIRSARAAEDVVGDFYRGLLARVPDTAGFNYWVPKFRAAQCSGGSAVNAEADAMSSLFAGSQEYANRARNDSQYVGDLYNAFLRRGGELAGVQFWINEIAQGRRSRESVRQAFVASPEFQERVAAITALGCPP